jgi:hypothetical protein
MPSIYAQCVHILCVTNRSLDHTDGSRIICIRPKPCPYPSPPQRSLLFHKYQNIDTRLSELLHTRRPLKETDRQRISASEHQCADQESHTSSFPPTIAARAFAWALLENPRDAVRCSNVTQGQGAKFARQKRGLADVYRQFVVYAVTNNAHCNQVRSSKLQILQLCLLA